MTFGSKDLAGCLRETKETLNSLNAEEEEIRKTMVQFQNFPKKKTCGKFSHYLRMKLRRRSVKCFRRTHRPHRQRSTPNNCLIFYVTGQKKFCKLKKIAVCFFIVLLDAFEKQLDSIDFEKLPDDKNFGQLSGKIMPGSYVFELLDQSGIFPHMRESISNLIDQMSTYLAQKGKRLWKKIRISRPFLIKRDKNLVLR